MKKYIIALATVAFVTTFISCERDFLDISQHGVFSVDKMYAEADDETTLSFIADVYLSTYGFANIDAWGMTQYGTSVFGNKRRLEAMGGDFAEYWSYTVNSESTQYSVMWSYYYSNIYKCNLIIDRLPANNVATASVKDRVLAEAHALRAIMMMYLVQLWGNPPLADHTMTGTEGNTPAAESWAFIERELAAAAEGLPSKSSINEHSTGNSRLTKEAVYAYLGKAFLWQGKYSEAATTLSNKVIATNLYGLLPSFEDLNGISSNYCQEYLWEYDINSDPVYATSQAGMLAGMVNNWGWNVNLPAEIYANQPAPASSPSYPSISFGEFMDVHDKPGGVESARYRGTLTPYEGLFDETRWTYSGNMGMKGTEPGCEGYFRIKFLSYWENILESESGWIGDLWIKNYCYMRYAEVLLNYAEAVTMGGTPGSMSGLEALNLVRQRAGLADAPSLNMDNETYGIKAERRAELLYDDCRFIDLVRWGDAATVLKDCGKTMPQFHGYLDGSTSGPESKDDWYITYLPTTGLGFVTNKNELFPIPTSEFTNNPNLTQNPGW